MADNGKAGKRRTVRAAGVVLWRDGAGETSVAVIHRPKYDDWTLPKGKLDPGETDRQAARRETHEETGHTGKLGTPLGEVRYPVGGNGGGTKIVRYWAMRADGGRFAPNAEVDELRWLAVPDAMQMLTHERDREVLQRFVDAEHP